MKNILSLKTVSYTHLDVYKRQPFDKNKENQRFSDETIEGIVSACFDMGRVCTGALIVVEQAIRLTEYEMTGIELDCKVSFQVLLNIFEHNTPLHDGAAVSYTHLDVYKRQKMGRR